MIDHEQVTEEFRVKTHETTAESDYWATFYEHKDFNKASLFCEFVSTLPVLPDTIIDIGCGQGRDSLAFAQAGKTVIGLDRSLTGIEHAATKAGEKQLDNRLVFDECDVSDEEAVRDILSKARSTTDNQPLCFYMRFFLHSIPEDVQDSFMSTVAKYSEPGDVFAAEFRTDKDEDQIKTFGNSHYRRYQNANEFSKDLRDKYGWENIVFETESNNLSPYNNENPTLYRVIATRHES